jgi:hypothetical protein
VNHRLHRALRRLALMACFAGAVGTVVTGSFSWLRSAGLGRPPLVFDFARMLSKRLPELAEMQRPHTYAIAVLGDSALVSYPEGRTVPDRLQRAIDRIGKRTPPIQIVSLGMSGTGPFDYYFLADAIVGASPDAVVIALNLDHLSEPWRGAYSRPQLAGLIEPRRLPEALTLPLYFTGLTTDQLLFRAAIVQAGGYDAWVRLAVRQAQAGRARDRLQSLLAGVPWVKPEATTRDAEREKSPEELFEEAANEHTLLRLFTGLDIRRYRAVGLAEHYRVPLRGVERDHPVLAVLGATIARLRAAGIAVLVYVVPADVGYWRRVGVLDSKGLARTLAAIERAVLESGGGFVDLHDLFPTDAFRDGPGHLVYEGGFDGPAQLAEVLAPLLVERAGEARD